MAWTVISFLVRVPVLSEQMTVTDPRVSTAGSWRMMALRRASVCIASAREMVTTAGRPSGMAATASTMAILKKYMAPLPHTAHVLSSLPVSAMPFLVNLGRLMAQQAAHMTVMMLVRKSPNASSLSCRGEEVSSVSVRALAILPISVSAPLFITTPWHLPYTRSVPEKRQFSLALMSASSVSATHVTLLGTPAASPVSAACSADRVVLCVQMMRRSAGILSPTETSTMSPGTSSLASTIDTTPPLRTLAWSGL
mmetsp:Transcript_13227/g.33323  ORF Transcript_13227/g.33323 Transcript_13227/m.33323 type:complete len:253 (-) Transcript_13227:1069-1827(-)